MKCMCGDFLIPDVMHRVDGPCRRIFEDMFVNPSSHSRECLRQNRCVCGYYERQNADFEARLKQAMAAHPDFSQENDVDTIPTYTNQQRDPQQRMVQQPAAPHDEQMPAPERRANEQFDTEAHRAFMRGL